MSHKLADTFDAQAELYDQIRPHYPDVLFQTIVDITSLPAKAIVLEIGAGTGQATEPLARRGYNVIALEPGAHLARVARQKMYAYPNVSVIESSFEDATLQPHSFDLIYSATAFHWVKPELQYTKTHELLKPGGYLAIIHTNHVSDEHGDAYFHASRAIHERYLPTQASRHTRMPKATELTAPRFDQALFRPVLFTYVPIVIRYSAKQYADLQHTYSPVLALPTHERHEYLQAIENLIHSSFGGYIDKHFAMSLAVAKAI